MEASLTAAETEKALQDLRSRLDTATCELGLIRSGDVTKYTAALNSLPTFQIEALLKLTDPEKSSNPNVSYILASISEPDRVSFVRSKSSVALQRAIVLAFVGVLYLKHGSRDKGTVVNGLGKVLRHNWYVDATNSNLEDAIYYFRKAIEVESSDAEGLDLSLEDLACTVLEKFKITRSITDFEEIREAFERAISLGRDGTPFYMSSLGIVWKERAGMTEEGKDALLDTSIDTHLKALNLLSLNPSIMTSGQIQYLHRNLAESYFERYEFPTVDPAGSLHDSVKSAMVNSAYRWMLLHELAVLHSRRYNLQGNRGDAEISIALFYSALEDQPNNSTILRPLGAILHQSGIMNNSPHNMSEGINVLEAVVAATPENDPRFPASLKSLSYAFLTRFRRTGDAEDLDKAIAATERALSHPCLDEATRWEYLRLLSDELLKRFETRNQLSDLDAASTHIQSALNSIALAPHSKALCLYSYGCILRIRSVSEPGLLDGAIESFKASLALLSTDQYELHAECYNDLGNAFTTKFQKTGSRDDLHQAIDFYLQAIAADEQATNSTSKRRKLMFLVGLGNAHVAEYQKWRRVASIDLAISCYQEVVDGTDEDDQLFVTRTGGLCFALGLKFEINKDEKLLKRAQNSLISILNRPKPLTVIQTPFIQTRLGAIFYQYGLNSSGSEAVAYFDQAADWFQKSLESSPHDFEGMRNASANLINVLVLKYKVTQANRDLFATLELLSRIMTQEASLIYSFAALHGLGQLFTMLLENQQFPSVQAHCGNMAIEIFSILSNESEFPSPPNLQAGSALKTATLIFELRKNAGDASRFLTNATELLSQAIIVGPNRLDHLRAIKELHTIPTLTLSMFLEAGEPVLKALQMCERGRCLVLDRLIDQKSDISNLEVSHPELAVRFEDLRETLAQNQASKEVAGIRASNLQNMNDCVFEYKQTLSVIRQQPGFENFLLLPEDVANILDYGVAGHIVLLNASKYRCDAILITSSGISHLPLPGVYEPTGQHLDDLTGITRDANDFNNLMKWLWVVVVRPVLDELGHTGVKDDGSLPRVWWMTSGWISPLPIHAAGDYAKAKETGEPCTVLDRVISSYIPTLKMLKFVRDKRKTVLDSQHSDLTKDNKALIVQMPVTPNNTDLPHVSRECELVEKHLQKDLHVTSRSCPKRSGILASLESASMAHFACHGVANTDDPSLSRLLLQDWRSAPFDVRFIVGMSTQCQFVYLSGCQTGSAANAQYLSTESIHISSAFLAAGVPYVVATLVDIDDEFSVTFADKFYSYLVEKNMDFSRSAEALHAAQVYARDSGIDPFQWLAFAHFGA